MKILITGGAGYIGSVLVQELLGGPQHNDDGELQEGWLDIYPDELKVTIVDNLQYKQTSLLQYCNDSRFKFIKGDVTDSNLMFPLIDKADVIIPLAAIVGAPSCDLNPEQTIKVNKTAIQVLAANCQNNQKIIIPTTNSGYGIGQEGIHCTEESPLKPISLYGKTKVEAEKYVLDYGGVSLRLATVFGVSPRMRLDLLVNDFTYKAYRDKYIVLFESHFKRNYIHVRDVAKAFIFAINHYDEMKGQAYNVGLSDANISKLELCKVIKMYISDFHIFENEIDKDPDQRNYIVSNEKFENLGWSPLFSLEDGIKELLKAYPMVLNSQQQYTNL